LTTPGAAADTIVALASPAGVGGVAVVRLSGPQALALAEALVGPLPAPRHAALRCFVGDDGSPIDEGIVLVFPRPRSFTGEDVVELQGHGGPVVVDQLLAHLLSLGARLARPGEFSERAFLNGRLDLVQAEAVADLIAAGSADSARLALRTLQGELSRRVEALLDGLVRLRCHVEATIDFPDEEIDVLADAAVLADLDVLRTAIAALLGSAHRGRLLRDGLRVVIAGPPNAGKSSLLNALVGHDAAIVTAIPGTTRDVLREYIQLDGLPLHVVDTAGLREAADVVEQEGIRRARAEIAGADRVLWVYDDSHAPPARAELQIAGLPADVPLTLVRNKIDITGTAAGLSPGQPPTIAISATTGAGLDALRDHLKESAGYRTGDHGEFIARRRHLDALGRVRMALDRARSILLERRAGELVAEDLRAAQNALGEITGVFTPDDLLDQIFSSFCIGK
jgi:tRNA modification GTPase